MMYCQRLELPAAITARIATSVPVSEIKRARANSKPPLRARRKSKTPALATMSPMASVTNQSGLARAWAFRTITCYDGAPPPGLRLLIPTL